MYINIYDTIEFCVGKNYFCAISIYIYIYIYLYISNKYHIIIIFSSICVRAVAQASRIDTPKWNLFFVRQCTKCHIPNIFDRDFATMATALFHLGAYCDLYQGSRRCGGKYVRMYSYIQQCAGMPRRIAVARVLILVHNTPTCW